MLLPCRTSDTVGWRCARWLFSLGLAIWIQSPAGADPSSVIASNAPAQVVRSRFPPKLSPDTIAPDPVTLTNLISTDPSLPPETNAEVTAIGATNAAATNKFEVQLSQSRYLKETGQLDEAEPMLESLLASEASEAVKRSALFELGAVVRLKNDLPRAEDINAQFADRWPKDPRLPEVLLRQGQIYRQMGLNSLALTKFYGVMTAALSLKSDQPDYYPALVLEAQTEIAETHYLMGGFREAADFYTRLLQQDNPALNRTQAQFRLIRSLAAIGNNDEAVAKARDFLERFPNATEQPEVRFLLANTLKQLGQNNEALQQVLLLLREEKANTRDHPELWAYWQQRAGNEVANQLYREGDYMRALDIYVNLAQLDPSPVWQLPVKYQIGLTYERLEQPQKAMESYQEILKLETQFGTNATPGQRAVFDMARWRSGFLGWQRQAESTNLAVADAAARPKDFGTNTLTGAPRP